MVECTACTWRSSQVETAQGAAILSFRHMVETGHAVRIGRAPQPLHVLDGRGTE